MLIENIKKMHQKVFMNNFFDAFLSLIIRCESIPSLQKTATTLRCVVQNVTTKLHIVEMWQ